MMTSEEVLAKAREFDPGIAEWIDDQLKRGVSPIAIVEVLRATTALVTAERKAAAQRKVQP